jgi:hypothetical protein
MTGWKFLGEARATGRNDRDVIRIGHHDGRFSRLMMVVTDSDLELFDLVVQFGSGQRWSPNVRQVFRQGTRSHAIDLPGNVHFLRSVEFRYGNLPGGGAARVELWGQSFGPSMTAAPPPPPVPTPPTPPPPVPTVPQQRPETIGWRLLGDARVTGRHDRDVVRVGRDDGQLSRLLIVVPENDLQLFDLVIQFGNGQRWSPNVRQTFREGARSLVLQLPGHVRFIRNVEFRYGNLPGGGRARVEVWGQ